MLATDLAYYLTGRGVAFRKAHKLTGEAVAMAEKLQIPLHQLSLSDLQKIRYKYYFFRLDVFIIISNVVSTVLLSKHPYIKFGILSIVWTSTHQSEELQSPLYCNRFKNYVRGLKIHNKYEKIN